MNISLLRHGFALILLSLIGGFFVSTMAIPRLGLSAHTIGALGGTLLIAVGAVWQHFRLSNAQSAWLKWSWLFSSYVNWLACTLGAVLGVGKMTPIASAGRIGSDAAEGLVSLLFISVAVTSLVAAALSLWGLRRAS